MQEFKPVKEGKVREVYDNGDSLIIVATDRISAFDHILKNKITKKGAILTQMSKFWFDYTKDIVPNHMISVDVKDHRAHNNYKNSLPNRLIIKSTLVVAVLIFPFHSTKTADGQQPKSIGRFPFLKAEQCGSHANCKFIDPYST